MAENKDNAAHAADPTSSAADANVTKAAGDTPLPVDTPDMALEADDTASEARTIGPFLPIVVERMTYDEPAGDGRPAGTDEAPAAPRRRLWAYAPLAATIALAVAVGALAGAVGTDLWSDTTSTATKAAAETNLALRESVAQLSSELATLKAGLTSAQRNTSTQFGKLAERLDRAEKAQAEPAAKLAKIQETVDRLDRRQQQAAAPAADVTGSVTPKEPKEDARPPVAEGWRLRDFYAGRAIVESRNGALFEVGPGSNLPGLGRVDSVKRENGRIVVVTRNGIITASLEPRRPPLGLPYRY